MIWKTFLQEYTIKHGCYDTTDGVMLAASSNGKEEALLVREIRPNNCDQQYIQTTKNDDNRHN